MNLMSNEKILLSSTSNDLILTTHRVRYQGQSSGSDEIKSIMLEELASCAMTRKSSPILLRLAGLCLVLGIIIAAGSNGNESALTIGIILAVILLATYLASRELNLSLASAGVSIDLNVRGMKVEDIKDFIDRAETAKNDRYLLLK